MSVSDNLRAARKKKGWTQKDLAEHSGVSQQAVSFIETGRNTPSEGTMRLLADALGCTVAELMGEVVSVPEDDVMALREELRRSPDMRMLFSAASKATPEHIRAAAAMLKALEPGEEFTE